MSPPLRLASPLLPPLISRDSGPGRRWLLFTQGCARPCTTRCLNPTFLDPLGGELVDPVLLYLAPRLVASGRWGPVEGLTLLGGEPSDQAEALLPLLDGAASVGLSIMLYSGRTRPVLEGRPETARLLARCDLLVDGPFLPEAHDPELRWRGSRNQQIHRLSARYDGVDFDRDQAMRGITVHLDPSGRVAVSGLQARESAARIEAVLAGADD